MKCFICAYSLFAVDHDLLVFALCHIDALTLDIEILHVQVFYSHTVQLGPYYGWVMNIIDDFISTHPVPL